MNIIILSFLFAMSMGDSVGIRMAKRLGEGDAERAAFVAKLGVVVSLIGGVFMAGALGVCVILAGFEEEARGKSWLD